MQKFEITRDHRPNIQTSYLRDEAPVTQMILPHLVQTWCEDNLEDEWTVCVDLSTGKAFIEFSDDTDAAMYRLRWK